MGFDIECIPNIELLPGECFCPVCRFLVHPNEALRSMCTHLYCPPCLAHVASTTMTCPLDGSLVAETHAKRLVESNKELADTFGEILVYCSYKKSGCTWIGPLSHIPLHCLFCAFRTSRVACSVCQIQIPHHQAEGHAQVCHQGQVEMGPHGRFVVVATPAREQQQYQPPYYNMHQPQDVPVAIPRQQFHLASQHQVPSAQPASQYVAQTHSQVQAQPQLQSQSSALHQPLAVLSSAPQNGAASLDQAYLSQDLSQTFAPSQGHQNLQAQAHSKTTLLSQPHQLPNLQVPQYQITSHQLHKPNPMHPQASTVQAQAHSKTTLLSQPHHLQNLQVPQYQTTSPQLHRPNPMHTQAGTVQRSVPYNAISQGATSCSPTSLSLPTMQTQQPNQPTRVGNRRANLGKNPIVEDKGTTGTDYPSLLGAGTDYLSMLGAPVDHNAPLGPGELRHLNYVVEYFNKRYYMERNGGPRPGYSSSMSFHRGFDQRSLVMPHENYALRPGNVGMASRYAYHGLPGGGGSGDMEPFPNSRKRAAGPVEGEGLHSQINKEDQQNKKVAKKPKI
ncbi:unnamed protein product [Microthlaspi erraticum]|uniref:RING-type domain-containing protein n=1 Tax=Microthlaspi erraticum TaxID=1685480 RepID=A0A6D2HN21_9BRAS|nr:unnamed protein product [Microthlaspi erraticum]